MQEASAKLASGQNAKIGHEINLIERSLDKMDLDMKGIELQSRIKKKSYGIKSERNRNVSESINE